MSTLDSVRILQNRMGQSIIGQESVGQQVIFDARKEINQIQVPDIIEKYSANDVIDEILKLVAIA